jgi:hypothetical protein
MSKRFDVSVIERFAPWIFWLVDAGPGIDQRFFMGSACLATTRQRERNAPCGHG